MEIRFKCSSNKRVMFLGMIIKSVYRLKFLSLTFLFDSHLSFLLSSFPSINCISLSFYQNLQFFTLIKISGDQFRWQNNFYLSKWINALLKFPSLKILFIIIFIWSWERYSWTYVKFWKNIYQYNYKRTLIA